MIIRTGSILVGGRFLHNLRQRPRSRPRWGSYLLLWNRSLRTSFGTGPSGFSGHPLSAACQEQPARAPQVWSLLSSQFYSDLLSYKQEMRKCFDTVFLDEVQVAQRIERKLIEGGIEFPPLKTLGTRPGALSLDRLTRSGP